MSTILLTWLIQTAFASTIILLCGSIALTFYRQPADGVRVVQWTLAATLAAVVLAGWPSTSLVSLELIDAYPIPGSPEAQREESLPQTAQEVVTPEETLSFEPQELGDRYRPRASETSATDQVVVHAVTTRATGGRIISLLGVLYLVGCGLMLVSWTGDS